MANHSRSGLGIFIICVLVVAIILVGIIVVPKMLSTLAANLASTKLDAPASAPTASTALQKARVILARVRDEIIPGDGQATEYGVTFSHAGYETLVKWNEDLRVESSYAAAFESLDMRLPCCGWSKPSRDERLNCACGHHQALEGLGKKLLSAGWARDAVQREVTLWNRYLFPKQAIRAEMEKRAQLDREIRAALEELKELGKC